MNRFLSYGCLGLFCLLLVSGCSSGGGNPIPSTANEQEQEFGDITTRAIGAFQPPVIASSSSVVVTGLTGSTLTSLILRDNFSDLSTTRIAFTSDRDGNWEIYVMNADGSGQTNLTKNAADDTYPTWSPDGKKIAFNTLRDGNYEIYVMSADGSGQTRLTNNGKGDFHPSWGPFLKKRVLVGTGGSMGVSAAGFLFAQNQNG